MVGLKNWWVRYYQGRTPDVEMLLHGHLEDPHWSVSVKLVGQTAASGRRLEDADEPARQTLRGGSYEEGALVRSNECNNLA